MWPVVLNEFDTIAKCAEGFSLSRFGDGEMKMAFGAGYSRQQGSPTLARALTNIIVSPHHNCIVGIPTFDPKGPKYLNWMRHRDRFKSLISPMVQYYSAFVTRPDSAPWIRNRAYAESVAALWDGKRAVVLCEKKGSMAKVVKLSAAKMVHVGCPHKGAFDIINELEDKILKAKPEIVIASAGPCATVLADRLSRKGIQCIDFGSAGGFLLKLLQ